MASLDADGPKTAAKSERECGIISKIKVLHQKSRFLWKRSSVHPLRKIKRSSEDGTRLQQAGEESTHTATPCDAPWRTERGGDSVALLRDDKAGRDAPLELISSSSGLLSQQVFETLPKCYLLLNFARFNIILIPKHTSIPKAPRLRGATTPLRACALDFW